MISELIVAGLVAAIPIGLFLSWRARHRDIGHSVLPPATAASARHTRPRGEAQPV